MSVTTKQSVADRIEALAEVLKAGEEAARLADQPDDWGTCNLDHPVVFLDGMRDESVQKAAKLAGIDLDRFSWLGRRAYAVGVTLHGQAIRRERMSGAACAAMKAQNEVRPVDGLTILEYQAMD